MKLNVAIPANVVSRPYYYANVTGSVPQALTVSGSTASIDHIPWDTCSGSPHAYLSLPNDWNDADQVGLPKDGREFVVTGILTVDRSKPATAASPPPRAKVIGPDGSATLHAGNNDIRFVLPTQLLKRLRKTSSENVLSLTSYSPGGARGETITRRVAIQTTKPKRRK